MTGTLVLLRLHLRRDRWMLMWWIGGGVVLYYSQAVSTDRLYATQSQLDQAAAGMQSNVAFIAMAGPARALDTVGGQVAFQAAAFGAIVAGLMSMFVVGRHTRAEEETGRDELVRAAAIGRGAPLAAAGLIALIANAALGGLIALSLTSYGLPVAGSLALGLACALGGVVFGAVMLVAAQMTDGVRAAYGITGAVMGIAYMLRAVGDIGNGALSWVSPIGWGQYMRAYAGESWWPALLSLTAAVVLVVCAVQLFDRRDIGSGLWVARPGPARGELTDVLGLAWRLQRGSVMAWAAGLLVGGLAYGSIGDQVETLVGDSNFSRDVFVRAGGSLVDSFYATLAVMLAMIGSGFTIASVMRLRGEESEHYAELLLSTGVSRRRWMAAHLVVTLIGTVMVVVAAALGLFAGYALVTGDIAVAASFWWSTIYCIAPVLFLGTVTLVAYAVRSSWAIVGWIALAFCFVVLLLGASLRLPRWLMDLSPFELLPLVPAESFAVAPWIGLGILSVALSLVAVRAFQRRDIA